MKTSFSQERVLSFLQACDAVASYSKQLKPAATEEVSLGCSAARFLAEPVYADRDQPPFSRSTRDGFAVRSADLASLPARLKIVGEIRAGADPGSLPQVSPGVAVSIMTGAPLPDGADAVLMVEHAKPCDDHDIEALRLVVAGENVVPMGAEAKSGHRLLAPGTRLTPAALAVAASAGCSKLVVYRRPRVAILTTGDEIVPVHSVPGPTQIRNSNLHALAAQVEFAGGEPVPLPIAPDEPVRLRELMAEALGYDLALLSGGVSMGKYDLVEPALSTFQAEFRFTGVLIQPGKPVVFGEALAPRPPRDQRGWEMAGSSVRVPFFGLPGNPISTWVTFELFVSPVVRALAGGEALAPLFVSACLKAEVRGRTGLTRFLPATQTGGVRGCTVEALPSRGSGDIVTGSRANCFLVVPEDRGQLAAGETVSILIPGAELR